MSRKSILALLLAAAAPFAYASSANQYLKSNSGLCFTENKGQWDDLVLFKAEGAGGLTWWIERDGFTVLYSVPDLTAEPLENPRDMGMRKDEPKIYPHKGHALKFRFVQNMITPAGEDNSPWLTSQDHPAAAREVIPSERLSHNNNYFLGNDPNHWAPNCGNYTILTCRDVWEGIDVNWYEKNGLVEFDFVVNPGADPNQIQMRIDGLDNALELTADGGELILPTSLGEVKMAMPEAYQPDGRGGLTQTEARFGLTSGSKLGIRTPEGYDVGKELIVDPLVYSTYLGGRFTDFARALALDGAGGVLVTGYTQSDDFPTTEGAYDRSYDGTWEYYETFITRLSDDGSRLLYSTYLGGGSFDMPFALALDGEGRAVVAGLTASSDFPVTEGALDGSLNINERDYDGFVTKLSGEGNSLIYSTYLGGEYPDFVRALAPEGGGDMIAVGMTGSADFPVTEGAYMTESNGNGDAFVARINASGTELIYSTYLGGVSWDDARGVASVGEGGVIVVGETACDDFPTTEGAMDRSFNGGCDAFVARISSDGSSLNYSTYWGGSSYDYPWDLVGDGAGGVVFGGYTQSHDFPTSEGAYDRTFNGGVHDAFVVRMSLDDNSLIYSTYLGGGDDEGAPGGGREEQKLGLAPDGSGGVVVAGYTLSNDFPVTEGAFDESHNGYLDAFISRLNRDGSVLLYSTFLGGGDDDYARAVAPDGNGGVVVLGTTGSDDFPTTEGAFDRSFSINGGCDAFVTCLSGVANRPPVLDPIGDQTLFELQQLSITLNATDMDRDLLTYEVENAPVGATLVDNVFSWTPDHNEAGSYTPTFRVLDHGFPAMSDEETITITVLHTIKVPGDYGTIQAALNASHAGDLVLVDPGIYNENIILTGHNVILASRWLFTNDAADIANTIINGGCNGTVVRSVNNNNTARLCGFTITGGSGFSGGSYGGGIYLKNSQLGVNHCIINSNQARYGGGIYATASNLAVIRNCNISSNSANTYGGGVMLAASSLTLDSCTIDGNSAAALGGGMMLSGSHPTITNSAITGNEAGTQGGGVYANASDLAVIRNCDISSNSANTYGGGVVLAASSLALDSCIVSDNSAGTQGGGMRIANSYPMITNTTITGNDAAQGGGVYETCLDATFNDCDISFNTATAFGGGMALLYSCPTLEGCRIEGNSAPQGAGIRLQGSSPEINHTAIVDNSAETGARLGGGISCEAFSCPVLTNCTFSGNVAGYGGAIQCNLNSTVTILNGILWGDSPEEIYIKPHVTYPSTVSVEYSDVEGGEGGVYVGAGSTLDWGDWMMDDDPLFVDAGTGDYHLTEYSPCVDTGDPGSPLDPDGSTADMGAYWYDDGDPAPDLDVPAEVAVSPKDFELGNAYPNPFNGAVRIPFSVPVSARVNVTLYDLNGRQVAKLVDEVRPAGSHEVGWVANSAPSGIYLVRMATAEYQKTQRLVLIK